MAKQDHDRAARFLRHLEPLQGALEGYCRRSLRDPNGVEDVLQNAVAKAFRDFHLYVEGTNFRAWIFRYLNTEIYAGNRAFQRDRHEALTTEPLTTGPMIEDAWAPIVDEPVFERILEQPEQILDHCDEALAAAVFDLPPLERSVLLLKAIGQFKHREIAEILETPMGTVMSALTRARQGLRLRVSDFARQQGFFVTDSLRKRKG